MFVQRPGSAARFCLYGFAAGAVCGLLGAGGGLVLLPLLRRRGLPPAQAHATALAVMVPLTALSGWLYLRGGRFAPADLLPFLPGGLAGAAAGGFLLPRLSPRLLQGLFSVFLLYSGLRMTGLLGLLAGLF